MSSSPGSHISQTARAADGLRAAALCAVDRGPHAETGVPGDGWHPFGWRDWQADLHGDRGQRRGTPESRVPGRRPCQLRTDEAYFLIPAGTNSLNVRLSAGTISLGFQDGPVIAPELKGSGQLQKGEDLQFPASEQPRIAYVEWNGEFLMSEGLVIEGVHLYSPDPSYVLYETLE